MAMISGENNTCRKAAAGSSVQTKPDFETACIKTNDPRRPRLKSREADRNTFTLS